MRGAAEVLANGLQDPQAVIKATHEYEISEDSLASFIEDHCDLGPYYWASVSGLRAKYEEHCKEMEAEPLSQKALSMRLASEFGVITGGRHSGLKIRIYKGIQLKPEEEEERSW